MCEKSCAKKIRLYKTFIIVAGRINFVKVRFFLQGKRFYVTLNLIII